MLSLIIIAVAIYIYIDSQKEKTADYDPYHKRVDYSYGSAIAQKIKGYLEAQKYDEAEELLLQLSADDFSHVVDYVCLNGIKGTLGNWKRARPDDALPNLFGGAYSLHMAWVARTGKYGIELSEQEINGFEKYLMATSKYLSSVESEHSLIAVERDARMIRMYMGMSDPEKGRAAYERCMAIAPNHVRAHLHWFGLIQPRWFGNAEMIQDYYKELPQGTVLQKIILVRLAFDGLIEQQNLLGEHHGNYQAFAKQTIVRLNKDLISQPVTSLYQYTLFNYIEYIALETNIPLLQQKYRKLVGDYYTLFPYGFNK